MYWNLDNGCWVAWLSSPTGWRSPWSRSSCLPAEPILLGPLGLEPPKKTGCPPPLTLFLLVDVRHGLRNRASLVPLEMSDGFPCGGAYPDHISWAGTIGNFLMLRRLFWTSPAHW